jgi:hypothetical protein
MLLEVLARKYAVGTYAFQQMETNFGIGSLKFFLRGQNLKDFFNINFFFSEKYKLL